MEALRVIGVAMAEVGVAGIGRLTLSRRERMIMVEPRGTGMALFTLRAADEVRPPQFGSAAGDLNPEMVAIAGAIIAQRTANFDPTAFRAVPGGLTSADRDQDEGPPGQTARGHHTAPGDRFDGSAETQSRAGNPDPRHDREEETSRACS